MHFPDPPIWGSGHSLVDSNQMLCEPVDPVGIEQIGAVLYRAAQFIVPLEEINSQIELGRGVIKVDRSV
jgi:hypothetical protein